MDKIKPASQHWGNIDGQDIYLCRLQNANGIKIDVSNFGATQNQLIVDFLAKTDKTTLRNLTQHTYFNLAGHASGSILNHELMMPLSNYLPVNKSKVPHGEIAPVEGTPFDFKSAKSIGKDMIWHNQQLKITKHLKLINNIWKEESL